MEPDVQEYAEVDQTSKKAKSYKRDQMLNEVSHGLRLFPSEGTRQILDAETLKT